MLADSLVALAASAGWTAVDAVDTAAWESAKREFAQLLSRGDVAQTRLVEQRLEETREELTSAVGADMGRLRAAQAEQWAVRLAQLMEEDPDAEGDLRALVEDIQAGLHTEMMSGPDHAVVAASEVTTNTAETGMAAVVHGNARPPDPTLQEPGDRRARLENRTSRPDAVVTVPHRKPAGHLAHPKPPLERRAVRLAPGPVFLAGRESLLMELDIRLADDDAPTPRTMALCGVGGSGKTSVAVEYAQRHLAETGVVWQFAAENATVLAAGFGELAAKLGARDVLDVRGLVASVHRVLATWPTGWLLVFDNAPDKASVEAFVPPIGRGQVLITSQSDSWPPEQALNVPVLDPEVGAEFLVNRTGDPDQQAACDLAGDRGLEGLPLALEQAAAHIQATGESLASYLASFRRHADERASLQPARHPGPVLITTSLAFERVQQAHPDAAALLRLLACCAPEAIPVDLLLRPRPGLTEQPAPQVVPALLPLLEGQPAVKDAIAALRRYSLISLVGYGSVSVHELIQTVIIDQMPAELATAWRRAAAQLIEAALLPDPERPQTWSDHAALLPHAQRVLAADSPGMAQIVNYLIKSGSYAAASELGRKVLEARVRTLGADHPDTLGIRNQLAYVTGRAGDAAAARDQFAALLPAAEQVLGVDHPDTLDVRNQLAYVTGRAGDAAAARDQFAALLPAAERVLGVDHPDTLAMRQNLANFTGYAGDPAEARDQFVALLPVRERVLGPEHPDTLAIREELASWTGQAGDAARARDQFTALLPVRERVLGPEHPDTLSGRHELASWMAQAGDAAAARDQFAALLPVRERVLGPEHPETLATRASLASCTGEAGDAAEARDQFAALLRVRERLSGDGHPDTLAIRKELASWTGQAGDAARARDQFAALLPVRERVLGPEHPDTLATRASLAYWTAHAGDAADARKQYAALLPVRERVLGPEHPDTLANRHQLAYWTARAGNVAAGRDQFAALLPVRERVLGPEHPDTIATRSSLAHLTSRSRSRHVWRRRFRPADMSWPE
jgi:tetratricopeptide repeat protein